MQEDKNLQVLEKEIGNHTESIHANMSQVKGVPQAMTKGKAAVQATLFKHLEGGNYEQVVLG